MSFRQFTAVIRSAQTALWAFKTVADQFIGVNKTFQDLRLSFAGIIKAKDLVNTFGEAKQASREFVDELRKQAGLRRQAIRPELEKRKAAIELLTK
jgi:hypothetical protein